MKSDRWPPKANEKNVFQAFPIFHGAELENLPHKCSCSLGRWKQSCFFSENPVVNWQVIWFTWLPLSVLGLLGIIFVLLGVEETLPPIWIKFN